MAIRHGSGMAAARASTSAMLSMGRSGERSWPAPLTMQGFRRITSSATAVVKIPRRSRYALAPVTTYSPASRECHERTMLGVIFPTGSDPNSGTKCLRSNDS